MNCSDMTLCPWNVVENNHENNFVCQQDKVALKYLKSILFKLLANNPWTAVCLFLSWNFWNNFTTNYNYILDPIRNNIQEILTFVSWELRVVDAKEHMLINTVEIIYHVYNC